MVADGPARGGYVLKDCDGEPDIVFMASGSEVSLCMKAAEQFADKKVRVVSMPSMELFDEQDAAYRASVIPAAGLKVAVEAGRADLWYKYAGLDAVVHGMTGFGASAPGKVLEEKYGFTPDHIAGLVRERLA